MARRPATHQRVQVLVVVGEREARLLEPPRALDEVAGIRPEVAAGGGIEDLGVAGLEPGAHLEEDHGRPHVVIRRHRRP